MTGTQNPTTEPNATVMDARLPPVQDCKQVEPWANGSVGRHHIGDPRLDNPPTDLVAAAMSGADARSNCQRMLDVCKTLNVAFRAEMDGHNNDQIARFQIRQDPASMVRLAFSTLSAGEILECLECAGLRLESPVFDVLEGKPLTSGSLDLLGEIENCLRLSGRRVVVNVLVDHPDQLELLRHHAQGSDRCVNSNVFIMINAGSDRGGVWHYSDEFKDLVDMALDLHARGDIILAGLYADTSETMYEIHDNREANLCEGMLYLRKQLEFMWRACMTIMERFAEKIIAFGPGPLVLSAGVRCLDMLEALASVAACAENTDIDDLVANEAEEILWILDMIRESGFTIPEIHAGDYASASVDRLSTAQETDIIKTLETQKWSSYSQTVKLSVGQR